MIEPDRPQMKIQHKRVASWIISTTDRHLDYVILLFSWQQRLCQFIGILPTLFWEIKTLLLHAKYNIKVFCVVKFSRPAD